MSRANDPARLVPRLSRALLATSVLALLSAAGLRSSAGLGARVQEGPAVAEMRQRASAWLALWLGEHGPLVRADTLLAVALAASALGRLETDAQAGEPERAREVLRRLQRADGSFDGGAPDRRTATWIAYSALSASSAAEDRAAADRARAFLDDASRGARGPRPSIEDVDVDPNLSKALRFLEQGAGGSSASALEDPEGADWSELYALAGGEFDARSAFLHLRARRGVDRDLLTAVSLPSQGALGGSLHRKHLAARLLDRYRNPFLIAPDGAEAYWPALLLEELRSAWVDEAGAFCDPEVEVGTPDALSTASGLLALDALAPWVIVSEELLGEAAASGPRRYADLDSDCETCHAKLTPLLFYQWEKSRHAAAGVGCADCHGANHSLMFREEGRVSAKVCGDCHPEAFEEFSRSSHARAMKTLTSSALFATTPEAMRPSCFGCHNTGYEHLDGSVGSCNFCHPGHEFSAAQAREPGACTVCHTGQDYPQDLAYSLSKHGVLWQQTRDEKIAPTCVTCHSPGGTHDDGFGMTLGSSGTGGILEGRPAPVPMRVLTRAEFDQGRGEMVGVCTTCHSRRFSESSLRDADLLKAQGDALLAEAVALLEELHAEGLLGESELLLGGEQLLSDPSVPGSALLDRFYDMWRFHYASAWKGAYHQSHSVSNHQSRPGLERDLEFIRAEARRLRRPAGSEGSGQERQR